MAHALTHQHKEVLGDARPWAGQRLRTSERGVPCRKQAGSGAGAGGAGGQGGDTGAGRSTLGRTPSECKGPGVRVSMTVGGGQCEREHGDRPGHPQVSEPVGRRARSLTGSHSVTRSHKQY